MMPVFDALDFLQQAAGDRDMEMSALERAAVAERLQDRAEEREALARRARLEQNAESIAITNRMAGDPWGHVRAAQLRAQGLADEVADLEARLEKARARQEANAGTLRWWAERGELVADASARSAIPDPLEASRMRAADALREAHEGRALVEYVRRQVRARRGGR